MIRNVARHGCARARLTAAAVTVLLLMSITPGIYAANVPVLMVLQYMQAGKVIQTPIPAQGGFVASPDKGNPEQQWVISAGGAIQSDARPGDRTVSFFQGASNNTLLLFMIKVRYYQNSAGLWVPQFQLDEEPLVARINGRWLPLTTQGIPSLVVQTGTMLPNADGYLTALEFGFTNGTTSIDGWVVQ